MIQETTDGNELGHIYKMGVLNEKRCKTWNDAVKYDREKNNGNGFLRGAEIEIKNKDNGEITNGKFHGSFGYDTFNIAPNNQPDEPKTFKKSDFLIKIIKPSEAINLHGGKKTYRKSKKIKKIKKSQIQNEQETDKSSSLIIQKRKM